MLLSRKKKRIVAILQTKSWKRTLLTPLFFAFIWWCFSPLPLPAQESIIDSLQQELKKSKHDTTTIKSSISLGEMIYQSEPDKAKKLWQFAADLCEKCLAASPPPQDPCKTFYWKYLAGSLNNIGFLTDYHGNTPKALTYYHKSLEILTKIKDKGGIATSSNNIGYIYKNQGDISKALEYYLIGLKYREQLQDKKGMANSWNNIGFVYETQGDTDRAFECYKKSLRYQREIGDKKGIAGSLTNIGSIYKKKKNIAKTLEYYSQSLTLREEIQDKKGIASSLNNLGAIYVLQGNFDKALHLFHRSLALREEITDKMGITNSLNSIASTLLEKGSISEALVYASRSLKMAQELGFPEHIRLCATTLKSIYKKQGLFGKAFEMYELENKMRDSVNNIENKKASISKQFQYEYEKKAAADSVLHAQEQKIKNARLTAQNAQLQHEKTQRFALYGGLLLVIAFAGFVFSRFKISQKQKEIIAKQKDEVDEQRQLADSRRRDVEAHQKEIIDSITYAKRLQKAILPHRVEILEHFPESFVIYKPKDIVAGDFYWAEKIGDFYFLAVADCTGHGVPGAIVSMVCSNALNRTVNEFGILDTGNILDNVRDLVLKTFMKSGEDIQDGMDISLCRVNKKTNEVQWSGANNPLWYFENQELKEVKADKQPIGKYDYSHPFTSHLLTLPIGTNLYLFTDGYSDQFNQEEKKMTKKRFRDQIIAVQANHMKDQKQILSSYFENWKGNNDQIDDICIIGIRI